MNRAPRDPYAGDAQELRERLRALTDEVQRNELLLRKTQAREIELLRAHSLGELFERIVTGLRDAYGLDVVTPLSIATGASRFSRATFRTISSSTRD